MDPALPRPQSVVVDGGRIVSVGELGALARFPDVEVQDLGGRTLLPGLIDAHHHLSIAALHPRWADLSSARTVEDLGRALKLQAEREPEAEWVRGAGWNETTWGVVPTRKDLDDLGLDRPVIVAHYTLHQCVVDSRGLDALGIGKQTPDPPGGLVGRRPSGEPDGSLVERAWSQAHWRSMSAYAEPARWGENIASLGRSLLAQGVTCVHDAACPPAAERVYATLARSGELPVSVLVMPHPAALLAPLSSDRLDGPATGEGGEAVRVGPVKLFADGGVAPAISARLAGRSIDAGIRFEGLETQVKAVTERGFRVAVHAIGNLGLESALDAFEAASRAVPHDDHRFRVEHATLASRRQIERLRSLGGVAVVQPGFLDHLGKAVEGAAFDDATWLPFGDLAEAGVAMSASSDAPCAFDDPLRASWHGATRVTGSGGILDPGQAVPLEDWLRAYTAGAAHAGGQEDERGSLSVGKRADLVVLEGDLDPARPPLVAQTWVGGRLVFDRRPVEA